VSETPWPWFRRIALSLVFLLATVSASQAQFPPVNLSHTEDTTPQQIRELVSKYCRLDYDGARLDPPAWSKLEPLVWWKSNPDVTQIDVISRYTVETTPALSHGKYTVKVTYRALGRFETGIGYSNALTSTKEAEFTVTAVNGEWRISDVEPGFPHPSRAAMLKWLNEKVSATQEPAAKNLYQEALRQLQAQSVSPFAK